MHAHAKFHDCCVAAVAVCSAQRFCNAVQVDVIVSEWMGYALLFESMLDSVLYARDRCFLSCVHTCWLLLALSLPKVEVCEAITAQVLHGLLGREWEFLALVHVPIRGACAGG